MQGKYAFDQCNAQLQKALMDINTIEETNKFMADFVRYKGHVLCESSVSSNYFSFNMFKYGIIC